MLKSLLVGLLLGLSLTIANEAVAAAPDDSGTVTGSGVVLIKRQPEVVRIMVDLSVAGKTAQEAMAALKTRRQASEAKLIDFGADEGIDRARRAARPRGVRPATANGDDGPATNTRRWQEAR